MRVTGRFIFIFIQLIFFQVAFEIVNSYPQKQWVFDTKAFDDKHQHILMPTSLLTGVLIGKMHEHVSKKVKINITTTVRPTIIDFISKIKKRAIHFENNDSDESHSDDKINCGCNVSVVEGIGEHVVENNAKINQHRGTNRELEEHVSHN
ncbi:uncharacterized protein LOC116346456 isoform X2 [Contarinia nasturtii]|uniref:uncharacterized protein LOC116346456 isoform X2 n=1 Tax=Contarinia nasturtii TaxID=265458 RepID=UPI0012D390FC|nr:uncharacterized protein LOC116346456 isoform X2 [Contarinia nasturtii]